MPQTGYPLIMVASRVNIVQNFLKQGSSRFLYDVVDLLTSASDRVNLTGCL
jgi:hypothetical protein